MCTVVGCGHNAKSSSITADDILGFATVIGVIILGAAIVKPMGVAAGIIGVGMLIAAPNWSRRLVGRIVRLLWRSLRVYLKRRRAIDTLAKVAVFGQLERRWFVELQQVGQDGAVKAIARAPVTVPAVQSRAAVEREVERVYREKYGKPRGSKIRAIAAPIGDES